ncbi:MAG: phosphate transport system permease protein [Blastocatellia bacterium]|jgi:phosphate transport system permease protein|nr:phosphate transport system permease protein [Blastocatellia bacterium]
MMKSGDMMKASAPRKNFRLTTNTIMTTLTAACAFFVVSILVLILGYIAWQGIAAINLRFLFDTPKPVGEGGGIGNAITGTLLLLLIASVIGMPFGIATGIYLAEFGEGRFATLVRFVADTLTGVPSIVVGVFVYTLIVLPMKQFSTLAGGLALALIMIPIVTRTTEEMIRLVPTSLREGALALGAPQCRVTLGVVLPAAASGIATGAMLAIARVSGETAPLLFTAFGSRFFNWRLDQPIASLTVQIYNYAISPYDEWHAQAWAATLVLMTLILLINITVRFFTRRKF